DLLELLQPGSIADEVVALDDVDAVTLSRDFRQTDPTAFRLVERIANGTGDDTTLWMAVQREWSDDEKGLVKLVSYNPKKKEWGAV
ncbi:hypothetical protein AB9F39_36990, partial [Rhizobium leguminosarum]|uniref:hypothetical protein n=1 Tax=Rhizobium leguminosarum TaxID=384 RepID=UPI003F9C4787